VKMQTLSVEKTNSGVRLYIENGVAHIEFDAPDARVNVLGVAVMSELDALLAGCISDPGVQGIVLQSAKRDCFFAGADMAAIEALETEDAARQAAEVGQRVFARIADAPKPVVAAVQGVCLGGGCEMALACHHRILADDTATKIGLPEVKLGILPGWGGTQRLPRVVGLQTALDLMLTGRTLDARRALRVGLADEIVSAPLLVEAAAEAARRLAAAGRFTNVRRPQRTLWSTPGLLDRTPIGHEVVLRAASRRIWRETQGHYPAPLGILDAVRAGLRSGGRAFDVEARWLGNLAVTPESRHLVRIFRLTEANKKLGSDLPSPARRPRQIGLVGAGVMGGGIAHVVADHDLRIRMKDLGPEQLLAAFRTARGLFREQQKRGRLDPRQLDNKMACITASMDYSGFGLCDVVIEAVVESLEVKRAVLGDLEQHVKPDCVLATNTSSLSIDEIAARAQRPDRVLGMHFFNPVHRMPLVEIVRGKKTSSEAVARTLALTRALGKTPVIVRDGPGFLVNRVLAPYLNESAWMFDEGADPAHVDALFRRFGMPMGPFELLDEIGSDVAHKVGTVLHAGLGDRMRPAPLAGRLHEAGALGKKTQRGMYAYDGKRSRQRKPDPAFWSTLRGASVFECSDTDALDRVLTAMVNEAARCLDDDIVDNPADLDLALIFGIGYPPFRGGLLQYWDTRGIPTLVDRLRELTCRYGSRFTPADRLIRMVGSGERFFPVSREAARAARMSRP
jgi:3-hydroxyacyl-CoA dehydrogenase/enoyl-CoA hydratase/3-hydroxybutyryl-CoA epimerase